MEDIKTQMPEIPITNDYIFKRIFTKKGNESILKDLLIAILNEPIQEIKVQSEVSLEKEVAENKLGRLDILAELDDKTIVNIELQVINNHNMIERTMFYWSGMYYNQLKIGENYQRAKRTISINILNYNEFEEGPYHEVARLRREYQYKLLTEKQEIHFIQIPKFIKEKRGTETKLEQWIQFISQVNQGEVEKAMEKNKEIKKAAEEYEILTGDEYERRLAYLRDKAIRDEKSAIESAKNIGRQEGIKEGIKEGENKGIKKGKTERSIEIAKKLLKLDYKIEDIQSITELSKEEIEKLKK